MIAFKANNPTLESSEEVSLLDNELNLLLKRLVFLQEKESELELIEAENKERIDFLSEQIKNSANREAKFIIQAK